MITSQTQLDSNSPKQMSIYAPFKHEDSALAARYRVLIMAVRGYVGHCIQRANERNGFVGVVSQRAFETFLLNRLFFIPIYGRSYKAIELTKVSGLEEFTRQNSVVPDYIFRRTAIGVLEASIRLADTRIPYKYIRQTYKLKSQESWLEMFFETTSAD